MAETVKCKAIILKETEYNETDKMLTAISDEFGKISISVKGAKRVNSKFLAVSQQFCYSQMELTESKNGIYNLAEAELLSSFYDLRCDYDILVMANSLADIALRVSQEELPDEELLRLLLNSLYTLEKKTQDMRLTASIFKIRLASIEGFLPEPHVKKEGTVKAIEHIVYSDMKSLFSFGVNEDVLAELITYADKAIRNTL